MGSDVFDVFLIGTGASGAAHALGLATRACGGEIE
jgi:glycerol-3-phosphate dehydrogenase